MPDLAVLTGFVIASLIVLLVPGPGVMYVVAQSAAHGLRAGFASVFGLASGALVHALAAAAGLSALLLASSTAFSIIKYLGAAYLVYLGIRTLMSGTQALRLKNVAPLPARRLFLDGVIVSVFNPKIAVFFLAFLPQFVAPEGFSASWQILVLGLIYVALAIVTDGAYAVVAGGVRRWVRADRLSGRLLAKLSGLTYIGLGLNAALADRKV